MNLILLEPGDMSSPEVATLTGARARHAMAVLKVAAGHAIRIGMINGAVGTGIVTTMTDPAWDGSLRTDWSKEVLAVVVVLERANSVMLTPLSDCWIPPDEGGVGHLLLSYAGAEAFGKDASPVRYPYLMVNLARQNLRKVAVTFWRPPEKPFGSVELPKSK